MAVNVASRKATDRRMVLSSLWIFAMFNYLYADFFSMVFNAENMKSIAAKMTPTVVLGWAFVMETAIAMIFLSRVLNYRANRWANIVIGLVHTISVAWTISGGIPYPYYALFAIIEIACTLFIMWYAWSWKPPVASVVDA